MVYPTTHISPQVYKKVKGVLTIGILCSMGIFFYLSNDIRQMDVKDRSEWGESPFKHFEGNGVSENTRDDSPLGNDGIASLSASGLCLWSMENKMFGYVRSSVSEQIGIMTPQGEKEKGQLGHGHCHFGKIMEAQAADIAVGDILGYGQMIASLMKYSGK